MLYQTKAKYNEQQEFRFHDTRTNLEQVRAEVEAERMREVKKKFKAKPVGREWAVFAASTGFMYRPSQAPTPPAKGADVQLNVAAVLREDALLRKKQEQEAQLIKRFETELRDSTEFYQWQNEMREKDDAIRKAQIEARRLEMAAAAQEAVEARYGTTHCFL